MEILKRIVVYFLVFIMTVLSGPVTQQDPVCDFPKAAVEAKELLLTYIPSDGSKLTLTSMQGLLANISDRNILFRIDGYEKWLPYTQAKLVTSQPDGSPWDFKRLLNEFAPLFDGYILCDDASAAIALSIARQKNSIVVLPEFEEAAQAAGLKMTIDVRGWTDLKLRSSPEFRKLNRKVAFEQPASYAPWLLDYAVMCGAYIWYEPDATRLEHTNAYRFLDDNALVFGWNPDIGEYNPVLSLSRLNACMVPADWAMNLSVLSGFKYNEIKQKTAAGSESKGRTVCLLMSDGDNLQWFTNAYADASHYGSSIRGSFPFAWGVPAGAADVAAPLAERYYSQMTENDSFVLSLSGLGYTYPSKWTSHKALTSMAQTLGQKMRLLDAHELLVLDDGGFESKSTDILLRQTQANGIFYIDFHDYSGLNGQIRFVDGKPIVSAKYKLWNNLPGGSPDEIASAINALPTDTKDPDSYAFIIVHAWSGMNENGEFVDGADTMKAVERLVSKLDADTSVVSPDQFMQKISDNLG